MKQNTKKAPKSVFICQSCGYNAPKWLGKCPECETWDSFTEERIAEKSFQENLPDTKTCPVPLDSIPLDSEYRIITGINEFDRVLGGGMVPGSVVLIGGDPGIGKSTLMLQVLYGISLSKRKALYVTGEESIRQMRIRGDRLDAVSSNLLVLSEIDIQAILSTAASQSPDVLVIDSIQTMFSREIQSAPGSVSQVREAAMQLMLMAKTTGIPVFLVGHVTKDGAIAGPRLLEHMVDTVLYFEGDRNHIFRILRAVKNRFGSTNELGVFEMKGKGLCEVSNPSAIFLSERPANSPGSAVTASMEGTRPLLIEIQALVSGTNFASPRRTILGIDQNRVALLAAVMEKKLGMPLIGHDIFMNVVGGVKVDEPAIDMSVICAISSSFLDRPIKNGTVVIGEIGLAGEIRTAGHIEQRLGEIIKMGFTRCIAPLGNTRKTADTDGIELVGVENIADVMDVLF